MNMYLAVGDQLADHGVIVHVDLTTLQDTGVHSHTGQLYVSEPRRATGLSCTKGSSVLGCL